MVTGAAHLWQQLNKMNDSALAFLPILHHTSYSKDKVTTNDRAETKRRESPSTMLYPYSCYAILVKALMTTWVINAMKERINWRYKWVLCCGICYKKLNCFGISFESNRMHTDAHTSRCRCNFLSGLFRITSASYGKDDPMKSSRFNTRIADGVNSTMII
jgi:hypothetical protein